MTERNVEGEGSQVRCCVSSSIVLVLNIGRVDDRFSFSFFFFFFSLDSITREFSSRVDQNLLRDASQKQLRNFCAKKESRGSYLEFLIFHIHK